jgi:hypothetical protein
MPTMIAEDKENVRPTNFNPNRKMRRGFSALLESAAKEHLHEMDEKVAFRSQCKDITNMVDKLCNDFDREDRGTNSITIFQGHCFSDLPSQISSWLRIFRKMNNVWLKSLNL